MPIYKLGQQNLLLQTIESKSCLNNLACLLNYSIALGLS